MKKITLLSFLAASSALTSFAAQGDKITNLEQLSNSKCYTITPQEAKRGTWVYNSNNPLFLHSTVKMSIDVDPNSKAQQFAFLKSKSGKYYVYNIEGQKFLSYTSAEGGRVALTDKPLSVDAEATFVETTANYKDNFPWVVALNGHHIGLSDGYSYGLITFYNSTADAGNCISITEAGDFNATEAVAIIEAFEVANTEENKALAAEANQYLKVPQYAVGGYDPILWGNLNTACGNDGIADIYDAATEEFKTALTAIKNGGTTGGLAFDNSKVYTIQNFSASNGSLISKEETDKSRIFSSAKNNSLTTVENSEYWQYYSKDGLSILYNQGTQSYAQFDAANNCWNLSKNPTIINVNKTNKGVGTHSIQDNNYTGSGQYMHINNGYETGVVAWNTESDASHFYFIEVQEDKIAEDLSKAIAQVVKTDAQKLVDSYIEGKDEYIGNYDQTKVNELKELIADENATIEQLKSAMAAVENSKKLPEAGKYYYIQNTMAFNDGGIKTIYENPDGTNIGWHTIAQAPTELWQLEAGENGAYYIKSANTGKFIKLELTTEGAPDPTATMITEKKSAFSLEQKDNSITLGLVNHLADGNTTTLVLQYGKTWGTTAKAENESGDYVGTYNSYAEGIPTKWNIVEANSVKVNIGESKHATLWLPYAVSLEGTNIEAYTIGSIQDGVATLKKVDGNIIPAKSAVILRGEAGSYDLVISGDATPTIESQLVGTNIATTVATDVNAYILGNVEGKVGFYQMDGTDRTMAANKAYLVLPASMSQIRSIVIGGPTTGIEETVTNGSEEEYYDLQGRRVMNPVKGIYVTKSGKKVLINK